MAQIVVNDDIKVNGKLTIRRILNEGVNEDGSTYKYFTIEGIFATHLYFDEITSLDIPRMKINDVEVFMEEFGSDDYNVIYHFKAGSIDMHGIENDGIYFFLYSKEMLEIEKKMYKNDHPILGDIGEEYKDIVGEENKEEGEE